MIETCRYGNGGREPTEVYYKITENSWDSWVHTLKLTALV